MRVEMRKAVCGKEEIAALKERMATAHQQWKLRSSRSSSWPETAASESRQERYLSTLAGTRRRGKHGRPPSERATSERTRTA